MDETGQPGADATAEGDGPGERGGPHDGSSWAANGSSADAHTGWRQAPTHGGAQSGRSAVGSARVQGDNTSIRARAELRSPYADLIAPVSPPASNGSARPLTLDEHSAMIENIPYADRQQAADQRVGRAGVGYFTPYPPAQALGTESEPPAPAAPPLPLPDVPPAPPQVPTRPALAVVPPLPAAPPTVPAPAPAGSVPTSVGSVPAGTPTSAGLAPSGRAMGVAPSESAESPRAAALSGFAGPPGIGARSGGFEVVGSSEPPGGAEAPGQAAPSGYAAPPGYAMPPGGPVHTGSPNRPISPAPVTSPFSPLSPSGTTGIGPARPVSPAPVGPESPVTRPPGPPAPRPFPALGESLPSGGDGPADPAENPIPPITALRSVPAAPPAPVGAYSLPTVPQQLPPAPQHLPPPPLPPLPGSQGAQPPTTGPQSPPGGPATPSAGPLSSLAGLPAPLAEPRAPLAGPPAPLAEPRAPLAELSAPPPEPPATAAEQEQGDVGHLSGPGYRPDPPRADAGRHAEPLGRRVYDEPGTEPAGRHHDDESAESSPWAPPGLPPGYERIPVARTSPPPEYDEEPAYPEPTPQPVSAMPVGRPYVHHPDPNGRLILDDRREQDEPAEPAARGRRSLASTEGVPADGGGPQQPPAESTWHERERESHRGEEPLRQEPRRAEEPRRWSEPPRWERPAPPRWAGYTAELPDNPALLPQRVPAEPDVPRVPGEREANGDPTAAAPELARIATYLRDEDEDGASERPDGFDIPAVLAAVRAVAGVRGAEVRTNPAGSHTLRLDVTDGADAGEVSRVVTRLLEVRMGLAAEPSDESLRAEAAGPVPPRRRHAAGDEAAYDPSARFGQPRSPLPPAVATGTASVGTARREVEGQRLASAGPESRPVGVREVEGRSFAGRGGDGRSVAGYYEAQDRSVADHEPDAGGERSGADPGDHPVRDQAVRDQAVRDQAVGSQAGGQVAKDHATPGARDRVTTDDGDSTATQAENVPAPGTRAAEAGVRAAEAGVRAPESPILTAGHRAPRLRAVEPSPAATSRPHRHQPDQGRDSVPAHRPLDGGSGAPRVVLDQVEVSTQGTDALVEVRLSAEDGPAIGVASGPAFDGYVLRLAAAAAANAIDELLSELDGGPQVRCYIEHATVVPMGSCEVAVVVLLLAHGGWVEELSGSAVVNGDQRQAVVRATLAAVNRRLEALLP